MTFLLISFRSDYGENNNYDTANNTDVFIDMLYTICTIIIQFFKDIYNTLIFLMEINTSI